MTTELMALEKISFTYETWLVLKKLSILLIIVVLALAIDGILTFDILDFKINTFGEWLAVGITLAIICIIYLAEASKKNDK